MHSLLIYTSDLCVKRHWCLWTKKFYGSFTVDFNFGWNCCEQFFISSKCGINNQSCANTFWLHDDTRAALTPTCLCATCFFFLFLFFNQNMFVPSFFLFLFHLSFCIPSWISLDIDYVRSLPTLPCLRARLSSSTWNIFFFTFSFF